MYIYILAFILEQYYDKIRHKVKEQELKNQLSFTLITKILMGTLGCVPAYDRYFIAGIKNQKVATGNYNIRSIMQLVNFYEKNADRLEPVREKMEVEGMPYPQMKMIDMGFWQVGWELDTNKGIQTAHQEVETWNMETANNRIEINKINSDMISLEKQISDVAESLKDVVTKSELADMMNSFVPDDDDKWLMFNTKFSSADEVYESIYKQAKSSIYVVDNYID